MSSSIRSDHPATKTAGGTAITRADLDAAVETTIESALDAGRHGILVKRLGYNRFTVSESPDVPFGVIYEREEWTARTTPGPPPLDQRDAV